MDLQGHASGGPSFYLVPDNPRASKVIDEPSNAAFIQIKDGYPAIYLDFSNAPPDAEISLGREKCNITLPDHHQTAGIARRHCFFKRHPQTGVVIVYDNSRDNSTQVYDSEQDSVVPLSQAHAMRSVAMTRGFNRCIAIGPKKYYKFRLLWAVDAPVEQFLSRRPHILGPEKRPFDSSKALYIEGDVIGSGAFGTIRKCVDVRDGKAIAVKRFHNLLGRNHQMAIREANNMLRLSANNSKQHEHILPIWGVEFDKDDYRWIELFMPLCEGSVYDLILTKVRDMADTEIAEEVLYQMAKALKFMAKCNLVHRDIKPANILYDTRVRPDGEFYYHFQLADFNLSNEVATARTVAGTPVFMAPEVYDRQPQSFSADIWSLFVTIVWIRNIDSFRTYSTDDKIELRDKITDIAQLDIFCLIRGMAVQDPKRRMSARRLVALLEGDSKGAPAETSGPMVGGTEAMSVYSGVGTGHHNRVPYISLETQRAFYVANDFSSQGSIAGLPSMDGQSALGDFSIAAGPAPYNNVYNHGRMDDDYAFRSPRNQEVVADGNAAFAGSSRVPLEVAGKKKDEDDKGREDKEGDGTKEADEDEIAGEEPSSPGDKANKGKGKEPRYNPAYFYSRK